MKLALAFAVLAAILASGCGSDDSASQPTTTSDGTATLSSEDVEKAFRAEVASGGVVSHDEPPPKSIDCVKGDGDQVWRCEVSPAGWRRRGPRLHHHRRPCDADRDRAHLRPDRQLDQSSARNASIVSASSARLSGR